MVAYTCKFLNYGDENLRRLVVTLNQLRENRPVDTSAPVSVKPDASFTFNFGLLIFPDAGEQRPKNLRVSYRLATQKGETVFDEIVNYFYVFDYEFRGRRFLVYDNDFTVWIPKISRICPAFTLHVSFSLEQNRSCLFPVSTPRFLYYKSQLLVVRQDGQCFYNAVFLIAGEERRRRKLHPMTRK